MFYHFEAGLPKRLRGWTKVRDRGAHCGKLMTLFQQKHQGTNSGKKGLIMDMINIVQYYLIKGCIINF